MNWVQKKILSYAVASLLLWASAVISPRPTLAAEGEVLGIHILNVHELDDATKLLRSDDTAPDDWYYVTIPLTQAGIAKPDEWQQFFDRAQERRIIPLVRLVTRFENGAWTVPTHKEITDQIAFLSELDWPTSDRHIIVFNEPNQAHEWAGRLDPAEYARVLDFTARWAKSEAKNYKVLPAGLDLAAPNGPRTAEAFGYMESMLAAEPEVFANIDYWNSHSYPNPGFVSSPQRTDKMSLRGFQHELAYLKDKTGRDYEVFITETGWRDAPATRRWLSSYYEYALQHVWSDPRVKGVTPFVLRGDPGPFAAFTFVDQQGRETTQYLAYQQLLRRLAGG